MAAHRGQEEAGSDSQGKQASPSDNSGHGLSLYFQSEVGGLQPVDFFSSHIGRLFPQVVVIHLLGVFRDKSVGDHLL